jgi:lysophospholipase L1-like esterase
VRGVVAFGLAWALALPAAAAEPRRVVALGDSITKGVRPGVKPEETFASLLQDMLKKEGVEAEVTNVGVGGERTDHALKRLDNWVLYYKPHVVTVMYGTNDSYIDKGRKTPRITADAYETNLRAIVAHLRQGGAAVVLMTEPRWGAKAKPNGLGENPNGSLEAYLARCRKVAKEMNCPLVDHYAHWQKAEAGGADLSLWTTDECHPNPAGHRVLAETMLPVVRASLMTK